MRSTLKATLAGVAALAALACLNPVLAGDGPPHIMNVRMPDGRVAQIEYFGDVPPQVVLTPAQAAAGTPPFDATLGFSPSFVALQRIAAMMDRQADLMMRQMAAMQEAAMNGAAANLPPGAQNYATSSLGGGNVCMRSVQITYNGTGAPQVVSHSAGNCGPVPGAEAPASVHGPVNSEPTPSTRPRTIEVRANGDRAVLAMAQPATPTR